MNKEEKLCGNFNKYGKFKQIKIAFKLTNKYVYK